MREAGGELTGYGKTLRTRQVFLCLEQLLVDAPQLVVASSDFARCFFNLLPHLLAKEFDAPQHAVQVGGEQTNLIPALEAGRERSNWPFSAACMTRIISFTGLRTARRKKK